MTEEKLIPLSVQPIVSYPREAQIGKTYLLTIDLLQNMATAEWPYDEEEYPIYCMLDTSPFFSNQPVGEPVIVIHRFGGTYGPAQFLLNALTTTYEKEGIIKVTLVNGWGVPIKVLTLANISISKKPADIVPPISRYHEKVIQPDRVEPSQVAPPRQPITEIRIFIASPSDMTPERDRLFRVINELNLPQSPTRKQGFFVQALDWRQHVIPATGLPKEVILEQLPVETWDIFIGMMWQRFGSPTGSVDPQTGLTFDSPAPFRNLRWRSVCGKNISGRTFYFIAVRARCRAKALMPSNFGLSKNS